MAEERNERQPLPIKNLADLKRHIQVGTEFVSTFHQNHPDIVGLTRVVTEVQTNAFYSKIKDQPEHPFSKCNYGKGFRTDFEKASDYRFSGSEIQVLNRRKNDGSVLYTIELYGQENQMTEINKEENRMNEWERLHRQAERYKEAYPPGTRVLLLRMGDDPRPVEDHTRGTVRFVDDIGTVHCAFDNGRLLGLCPGEDSFRKLTEAELAEEQNEDLTQEEGGPVMGM